MRYSNVCDAAKMADPSHMRHSRESGNPLPRDPWAIAGTVVPLTFTVTWYHHERIQKYYEDNRC